ncbi:hypothetical protein LOZ65_004081 [Ophidiomyces ophidiicola]|nr:hypothetical protein LOZ65_004081 [Ophidiomyces ophidiicola]
MDTAVQTPKAFSTLFLDQPPSCLKFCPTAPNHLLISTYLLTEVASGNSAPNSVRTGSLQLFRFDPCLYQLSLIQRLPLDFAVFDFQFSPHDPSLFAVALSTSVVSLYRIETTNDPAPSTAVIKFVRSIQVHESSDQLALFLAWIPHNVSLKVGDCSNQIEDGFAVSFSDGRVSVFFSKDGANKLHQDSVCEMQLTGYPVEIWHVAFHFKTEEGQPALLFAGDDMQHIRAASLDTMTRAEDMLPCSWQVDDRGRFHDAGVTCILPLFHEGAGTIVLTGSYDEHIRVYHFKPRPEVLASKNLGGGVWRLKLIKEEELPNISSQIQGEPDILHSYTILASCMHGGARILRVTHTREHWEIEILVEFKEHQSMNYASDAYSGARDEDDANNVRHNSALFVTSSFYDKRVCVWEANL